MPLESEPWTRKSVVMEALLLPFVTQVVGLMLAVPPTWVPPTAQVGSMGLMPLPVTLLRPLPVALAVLRLLAAWPVTSIRSVSVAQTTLWCRLTGPVRPSFGLIGLRSTFKTKASMGSTIAKAATWAVLARPRRFWTTGLKITKEAESPMAALVTKAVAARVAAAGTTA